LRYWRSAALSCAPFGECFLLDLDPLLLERRHISQVVGISAAKRDGCMRVEIVVQTWVCVRVLADGCVPGGQTMDAWLLVGLAGADSAVVAGPLEMDRSLRRLVTFSTSPLVGSNHVRHHQTSFQSSPLLAFTLRKTVRCKIISHTRLALVATCLVRREA
jgi:hypothetical protein